MKKNKKFKNKIRLIIFILVMVILAVLGTLYEKNETIGKYLDKYLFFKEKYENDLPKIPLEQGKDTFIFEYKKNILVLSNNVLTVYNRYGKEEYKLDINISNPIFSSNENYLAIAEKNGTDLYVISGKNIIWQQKLEENIFNIKINTNGYLIVATEGTIDKNIIQAFDNKGNQLFKYFISSTYIVDMDISPDNKYVAIAEVNCGGILVQSNIKIISIDKVTEVENNSIVYTNNANEGDLVVNIKYQDKGNLEVVYDNHIEIIKNFEKKVLDYSEEDVLFVDINNKIVKIINKDSKVFLQIIDDDLKTIKEYNVKEPKEIYTLKNTIALNLGSKILFYNTSGWLIKEYYANQEIDKIVLGDQIAAIVYNDKIELISL